MGLIGKIALSLGLKKEPRAIRAGQRIHKSAIERMQEASAQEPYVPKALYNGITLKPEWNPGIQPWGGF